MLCSIIAVTALGLARVQGIVVQFGVVGNTAANEEEDANPRFLLPIASIPIPKMKLQKYPCKYRSNVLFCNGAW
jgi:hypothetical protein